MKRENVLELISGKSVLYFNISSFRSNEIRRSFCAINIGLKDGKCLHYVISKSTFNELRNLDAIKMKYVFINGVKQ